jgi:hypothetical protein
LERDQIAMTPIEPADIRYIKLGSAGRWAGHGLAHGELPFGYKTIPHDICQAGDWDAVTRLLIAEGRSPGKAKDALREIRDFYTLGPDCLWITFAQGHLWWAFAESEVVWLGTGDQARGIRMRKTRDGWHRTDIAGTPLRMDGLSTRLTQVAAYRQTICAVKAAGYLLRRINGLEEPAVGRARAAKAAMTAVAAEMIAGLHWSDFETLVDLIFARSGWLRVSRVGESLTDVDLILEQPASGEKAFVQVKSKAGQAVLDDYAARYRQSAAYDRMFFVCHSPKGALSGGDDPSLHVWAGAQLAKTAVSAGLFDWLIERTG